MSFCTNKLNMATQSKTERAGRPGSPEERRDKGTARARTRLPLCFLLLVFTLVSACGSDDGGREVENSFRLTVLHNNDGESRLIHAGRGLEDFGGAARFAARVHKLREEARTAASNGDHGVIVLSSGDNFLASPEFDASLKRGIPYFDSLVMNLIGYDAIGVGNHEFDMGPEILANFVEGVTGTPFVSANLDFKRHAQLKALAEKGRIVPRTVLDVNGEKIGIVGATTPRLRYISRPRNVAVRSNLPELLQAQIDRLKDAGVNKIILISHLQSIKEDLALAEKLRGLDIMIAGGGNELLASEGDRLIPGEGQRVYGDYPAWAEDADGKKVPVVTTNGDYRYVGRLIVDFDAGGNVVAIDEASGPVRVAGGSLPDAIAPDPEVEAQVTEPVSRALSALKRNAVATTEVPLDGRRFAVRTRETNLGDLVADALLAKARVLAPARRVPSADVAIFNGGGVRNNTLIPPGRLTERDTFDILPFPDLVTLVADVGPRQLKELLENAVSQVDKVSGRFPQVSGFRFIWSPERVAQRLDDNGRVIVPGNRVRELVLDDGRVLVRDGAVVRGTPPVNVATSDFLARGGDQYPYRGKAFVTLGVSGRKALADFLEGHLEGSVSAAAYPEGGSGRIVREDER